MKQRYKKQIDAINNCFTNTLSTTYQ